MTGLRGFACATLAAICFGVQYVPVKKYEISDGTAFQWFMCCGIVLVGFAASVASDGLTAVADEKMLLVGGILWSLSNYAVIPLVRLLGIGVGFSLYHFVNLVVSYAVGRFGLLGISKLGSVGTALLLCDAGCVLILVSFGAMVLVEGLADPLVSRSDAGYDPVELDDLGPDEQKIGAPDDTQPPDASLDKGHALPEKTSDSAHGLSSSARSLGVCLAIVAGGLCGVQSVPATLYNASHPGASPLMVTLPHCLGIWFGSTVILLLHACASCLFGAELYRPVLWPPMVSGGIWACGFTMMMVGIRDLGFSVGYTLDAVGPIMVSSFLSLVVFKEIKGRSRIGLYAVAQSLQLGGVLLIACFGQS